MNKEDFEELFKKASDAAMSFALEYVSDDLPSRQKYFLKVNEACKRLKPTERTFENLVMSPRELRGPVSESEVVERLWIDGLIPVWIDISVYRADEEYSYLDLRVCNRFSLEPEDYYYNDLGMGPFGIKSPTFPPGWADSKGKFSLMERVNLFQHHRVEIA